MFSFHVFWSEAWRILSITLPACELSTITQLFQQSLALPFFWTGMKIDLFQSCGHCWVFQICWHIKGSTLTASSFRIWNSSVGIPWPPLALFIVVLPKVHLTLHSRMSGSGWLATHHCGYLRGLLMREFRKKHSGLLEMSHVLVCMVVTGMNYIFQIS